MKAPTALAPAHMSSKDHPRLPFKGTIFLSMSACAGLWFLSVRAESLTQAHGAKVTALLAQTQVTDPNAAFEAIDLGSPEDLEAQLEPYMPLAGFDLSGLSAFEPVQDEEATDEPVRHTMLSVSEVRAARLPGWVYPAFDQPAEGLHGPPATELPRNIHFELVNDKGMPAHYDAIQVFEQTVNGPIELHAYRTTEGGAEWSFGIRRLMTGATAYFLVEANYEGQPRVGTMMLEDPSADININAGILELRKKTKSAWGTE